jgi:phosphoribosylformylglycinamidine cyclo-ligase
VVEQMLPVPAVFDFVERENGMSKRDMLKVFNYGVGLAVFVRSTEDAARVVSMAETNGLRACVAGRVEVSEKREVVVKPLNITLSEDEFTL